MYKIYFILFFLVPNNTQPTANFQQSPQPIGLNFGQGIDRKKPRGRITKADIGMPTNFKHVTHVGWSAQSGFDLTGDDVETLKPFLQKAGVSDQQLNDRETRAFIYDFIQNHNVLESVKSESHPGDVKQLPAPPVPTRNQNGAQRSAPPPPPRTQAPPPPLPSTTPPSRGPPPSRPPPIVHNNSSNNNANTGPVSIFYFGKFNHEFKLIKLISISLHHHHLLHHKWQLHHRRHQCQDYRKNLFQLRNQICVQLLWIV